MSAANNPSSMPSWQSMQRLPGASSSPTGGPPSSYRGVPSSTSDYGFAQQSQQQQAFPGSQNRFRPSNTASSSSGASGSDRGTPRNDLPPQPFPQQGGNGPAGNSVDDFQPQNQQGQPPPHRRTQSLRPMSAFQPLDNVDALYAQQGGAARRPPSPTGSTTRSIRTAAAPLTFKSPELRSALGLQEAQAKKIYMEGYLSKRDHLTPDGKPLPPTDPKKRWQLCFIQLSGTVLSVWNVQQMEEAARQGTEVPPSYINVTDCFVDFIGTITESPQDVPGSRGRYENVFALNTAGQNRVLFGVEGSVGRRLVQAWVNGIRLATWEKVRLEEIYTGSLVRARLGAVSAQQATSGPGGAPGDVEMSIKSPLSKNGRMEGWIKARFMGSTEWRKCWLVLSDKGAEGSASNDQSSDSASVNTQRNSFWSKLRAGDRSSIIGSPSVPNITDTGIKDVEVPPGSNGASGLACFYDTKKAKKPFATMAYASHAFAVYPSRPELVEGSSLFKVEGAFPLSGFVSATNRIRQTGWVMIMPELDSNSSKGANAEMMKWCIAFMDAFKLYGRPTQFQWDARNPISPFFAYPIGPYKDRLFLDRELSEFLDIREERHLANRNNLHGIMSARMRGERTPILPPLPQPNVESTRGLNGPRQGEQSSNAGSVPGSSATTHTELPPLNVGNDTSFGSRAGQLSSIGERSREGSVMTNFTQTPVTPVASEALSEQDRPSAARDMPNTSSSQPVSQAPSQVSSAVPEAAVARNGTLLQDERKTLSSSPMPGAANDHVAPQPPIKEAPRKESDPLIDEGALRYINSLGDSLPSVAPAVAPKSAAREKAQSSAMSSTHSSDQQKQVSASVPAVAMQNGMSKDAPAPNTPAIDGIDSDARAAYSFLDRPPSPPVSSSSSNRAPPPSNANVNEASSTAPSTTSFPSSFNSNSKAQERKMAAQAQAQAHADALAKPGRAGGAIKKSRLGAGARHAWGDDDDDDDDDDDEDDESTRDSSIQQGNARITQSNAGLPASIPQTTQSPPPHLRQAPYNSRLSNAANAVDSRGNSPAGSFDSQPRQSTLVHLSRQEQPGAISTAFQPQGLLQAGEQEKAERSARQMEAEARASGGHFVHVDNKPNAPQAGLVGAITAHERERRKEGGLGATLTERERERAQAERRQREDDAAAMMQMQQQQQQQAAAMMGGRAGSQAGWPAGGMPPFNPMMWQQMQMMSMMNPMMFGGGMPGAPGSSAGHGQAGGSGEGGVGGGAYGSAEMQQQHAAQMRAAQAAQQAYMQALHQGNGQSSGTASPPSEMSGLPSMTMPMMPFNPYMSMYGMPMGFQGWAGGGSEVGGPTGAAGMTMTPSPSGMMGSPPRQTQSPDQRSRMR